MAKPGGSTCNLDCKYCFYLSKETLPKGPGTGEMSDDILDLFIRQYIEGVTGPQVVFSLQGVEPTLRGLDFYRRVVALQKKYAKPNQRVENDLQTTGVLGHTRLERVRPNRLTRGFHRFGVSDCRCCPLPGASAAPDQGRSCRASGAADMQHRFASAGPRRLALAPAGTRG